MNICCEGDYGDAVFVLAILNRLNNGPHTLLLRKSTVTKIRTDDSLEQFVRVFKPLADKQPYVAECRALCDEDEVDWDSGGFRGAGTHSASLTLVNAHVRHMKMVLGNDVVTNSVGDDKWLSIKASKKSDGRVVINRTFRYRNQANFPWKKIVEFYGDRLLFVGHEQEHADFCNNFGVVDYQPTKNLLEVGGLIAGSLLFIGNQSCANAIAEGLKHPMIQETCLTVADCIFKRSNAQHVAKGVCTLPGFDGVADFNIDLPSIPFDTLDTATVPPGEWQLKMPDGSVRLSRSFGGIVAIGRSIGMTRDEVVAENVNRNYEYFFNRMVGDQYGLVEQALSCAGYRTNN